MRRKMSIGKKISSDLKRKATKNAHEFAYMAIWGEEVPKGKKTLRPRKNTYR